MYLVGLMDRNFLCGIVVLSLLTFLSSAHAENRQVFKLPSLAIDAERATYQSLISRPQDELPQETIELRQTSNPVELLRSTNPSITGSHSLLGAIFTPSLRGFAGMHTKVMLDGSPLNTPWNHTSSLSGLPMRRFKKISVQPGGPALVYGPNTVAGAVNLVLPTARDLEGLTIQQEVGGKGTRHQEFIYGNVSHQNEHLFALFMDEYHGTRRYKTHGTGGNSSDNRMFMYRGRVETDNDFILKATILESQGTLSVPNYMQRFEPWEMSHHDFVVEKDFGNDRNMILRFTKYRDYSANQLYTDYSLKVATGTIDHNDDVTIEMRTMEALYNFPAGERHYFTIGAQQQRIRDVGHGVKAKATGKWLDTKGFFISDSIRATDDLNLHLVARSDESYESDSETTWSAGANYQINHKSSFAINMSKTARFPNVQELYRSSRVFGNENLNPEKADNLELRLSHEINEDWQAVLTRFATQIDNLITTTVTTVDATIPGVGAIKANNSYYKNIDKAEIGGWELGISGTINRYFATWANYTRFDTAKDKTNNTRLVSRPDYRATLGTTFHQGRFNALLSFEHQGPIKETRTFDSSGKATIYDSVKASTCISLGLRQNLTDDFSIYVNVENLADKDDIILMQSSDAKNKAGLLTDPVYYRDGRIVTFGTELKF